MDRVSRMEWRLTRWHCRRFRSSADYVMCFNSDKWEKQIEITVEVAASVETVHLL